MLNNTQMEYQTSRFKACDKKSFRSKKEAQKAAKTLQCSPDVNVRIMLRAYRCDNCEFWHLTHHTDSDAKVFFRSEMKKPQ